MSDKPTDPKVTDSKVTDAQVTDAQVTGTTGAPNPKTGSADAARGVGGHSKDASHEKDAPAGYVEKGETKGSKQG